ncbi:MAG: hypothetical protein IKE95_03065 [Methanobrevibacter sp.]|nr:hypothetical protein [Methanobrevibacter sp.]
MLSFRITVSKEDGEFVFVRIDELKDGEYHFFDLYKTTSQSASSMLILEREKARRGDFYLEVVDRRERFVMV